MTMRRVAGLMGGGVVVFACNGVVAVEDRADAEDAGTVEQDATLPPEDTSAAADAQADAAADADVDAEPEASVDAGSDGSIDAGVDAEVDAGALVLVANDPRQTCPNYFTMGPGTPGFGTRWAARLTPKTYPFTIESVYYFVKGQPVAGDESVPHKVELFAGGNPPPASPALLDSWTATATTVAAGEPIKVEHTLAVPVVIAAGDFYLSLEMAGIDSSPKSIAVSNCAWQDPGPQPNHNSRHWYTLVKDPPFTWYSWKFGGTNVNQTTDLRFGAYGR